MWREFISGISPDCEFHDPASQEQIDTLAKSLKVTLPADLVALLRESNGIDDTFAYVDLVWSSDTIRARNLQLRTEPIFRETYKPLDSLLFFGSIGSDGILIGYSLAAQGTAHASEIIAWVPIPDTRDTIASSLAAYIRGWLTSTLNFV